MADSNIGALPQAPQVADDSLFVMEQQGTAMHMTGAQLKEYAKQGVEMEFQGYLDDAQEAADNAATAVAAVTGMTVEANTLASGQPATVSKTIKRGVVNLTFGLPRGEQGERGLQGDPGPRGPQGEPGAGLKILGHYDTVDTLNVAVMAPNVGDAYGVGSEIPYDVYVFDGVTLDWKNYGPMSGGGGVAPENVVTSQGGASFEYGEDIGDTPHVITFTYEEEPPLTAEDITYGNETVKEAIDGLKSSVSDGKSLIASAITDKGVATDEDATFSEMADNIGQISTGVDTGDATATAWDVLSPKTAYTSTGKVTGRIPSLGAQTITPGTSNKTIANGQYLSGTQTIKGDANLTSANIKNGVSIFGVMGALESSFKATLTVTVEVGAQVTATSGSKSITALSTTGTVVMELPSEGTWSITAARGMTQYNTVVINVTSSYSAELTAEIYIEYYGDAPSLSTKRNMLVGISTKNLSSLGSGIKDYAIFAGGNTSDNQFTQFYASDRVDAYDSNLTHTMLTNLSKARFNLAATTVGTWTLFGGGSRLDDYGYAVATDILDSYNQQMVRSIAAQMSVPRSSFGAAYVKEHALFGGGKDQSSVDAYSKNLTKTSAPILANTAYSYSGTIAQSTPNDEYAIFANQEVITAYDKNLSRSTPAIMGVKRTGFHSAIAGNYVLFAGGAIGLYNSDIVDAYDLYLTRTTPMALSKARLRTTSTTLDGFAMFIGGEETGTWDNNNVQAIKGIEIYDAYLVRTGIDDNKSFIRSAAATIGNYALVAGGLEDSIFERTTVRAYQRTD